MKATVEWALVNVFAQHLASEGQVDAGVRTRDFLVEARGHNLIALGPGTTCWGVTSRDLGRPIVFGDKVSTGPDQEELRSAVPQPLPHK